MWTAEVIMSTHVISDVQLSPDNAHVLFVAREAIMTEEKNAYVYRIYKAPTDGSKNTSLFSDIESSSIQPRWSPNGEWIAFLSTYDKINQLCLIPAQGGQACMLTQGTKPVQTFAWSPDSKKIAFVMEDTIQEYRPNVGQIYPYQPTINRLWLLDIASSFLKPLTTNDYCVRGNGDFATMNAEFDFAPDGQTLIFAYTASMGYDSFYLDSHIATVNITTNTITPWEKKASYEALPRYSPDGLKVAYLVGNKEETYAYIRRIALRSSDGTFERILAPTFNEGPFLAGPSLLGWTADNSSLLFLEPKGTRFHIALVPADGSQTKSLDTGNIFFKEPYLSHDKTMLAFVSESPSTPPEAYVSPWKAFDPLCLSNLNHHLLDYPQAKTEILQWKSADGLNIEGLITYPPDYTPEKSYPLLLIIHGGPMSFFDESYLGLPYPYPHAAFADAGFILLRPNPRGSCGYGADFRKANYADWGGMDFKDIMAGVDMLVSQNICDPKRLGVMGWSYGGYMTAWTITQTPRFQAASMGAGISNLVSLSGTMDLQTFTTNCLGDFLTNPTLYQERSPLYHVRNVMTPCLIQHGTADARVPVSQAHEFYRSLIRSGKPSTLVLYPNMGHRFTDPKLQLDVMKHNLDWFQDHLLKPSILK